MRKHFNQTVSVCGVSIWSTRSTSGVLSQKNLTDRFTMGLSSVAAILMFSVSLLSLWLR